MLAVSVPSRGFFILYFMQCHGRLLEYRGFRPLSGFLYSLSLYLPFVGNIGLIVSVPSRGFFILYVTPSIHINYGKQVSVPSRGFFILYSVGSSRGDYPFVTFPSPLGVSLFSILPLESLMVSELVR